MGSQTPICSGAGTGVRRYVLGPDPDERWSFLDSNGTINSPHTDREGTLIAMSNNAQAVGKYAYDAYGQNSSSASDVGPGVASYLYRYTGQRLDPNTGLYDYKAREYSPGLGRFLQADPAGLDQGPNLYEYVGDDPVNHADPSGKVNCPDPCSLTQLRAAQAKFAKQTTTQIPPGSNAAGVTFMVKTPIGGAAVSVMVSHDSGGTRAAVSVTGSKSVGMSGVVGPTVSHSDKPATAGISGSAGASVTAGDTVAGTFSHSISNDGSHNTSVTLGGGGGLGGSADATLTVTTPTAGEIVNGAANGLVQAKETIEHNIFDPILSATRVQIPQ